MRDRTPRHLRDRARHAGLAVMMLAIVGAGLHALFGEFAIQALRAGAQAGDQSSMGPLQPVRQAAAGETWRGLVVAPEHRCSPYVRTHYPYPQSVEAQIVAAMGGRVYGPYTGRLFSNSGQGDIEHMVATSEAHDSGLCAASAATRRAFARDLINLTLAAPKVNRCGGSGKCGKDAGEWLPARNGCWFAARVIQVRQKYGLTIDRREARALEQVLSNCTSTDMVLHGDGAVQPGGGQIDGGQVPGEPARVPATAGSLSQTAGKPPDKTDALARWDDNRDGQISCKEARRHAIAPVVSGHPAYRYMRDGDGDGVVCE